eukprot:6327991-Prorocentrum_lima.AAC.1
MDASVIPGRAPVLVVAPALAALGAAFHHGKALMYVPSLGDQRPLPVITDSNGARTYASSM